MRGNLLRDFFLLCGPLVEQFRSGGPIEASWGSGGANRWAGKVGWVGDLGARGRRNGCGVLGRGDQVKAEHSRVPPT